MPQKCHFFKSDVTYLGHHISEQGILPDKSKFSVIFNYPVPKTADETRRFVAFCNYYRRFIPKFAEIACPLNKLLRKNVIFKWDEDCQNSFNILKNELLSPRILKFPDFKRDFILTTDASKMACGAVLAQRYGDTEFPIAFASKAFTKGESNKSTPEQELLAIHWAITHFRPYLYGRKFYVKTDHRPLIHLFSMKNPSSRLTRIRLDLEEYDFEVIYIKGKTKVSDALSRIQINAEGLKQLYVITRAMKKRQNGATPISTQAQEPDQFRVYEPLGSQEAFMLPKLSFVRNSDNTLDVVIYKKNYTKGTALGFKIPINGNKETILMHMNNILKEIENGAPTINASYTRENTGRNIPNKIAMAKSDIIFKYLSMDLFKKIGNCILRNTTVLLFEKPKVLTSRDQVNNILQQFHNLPTGGHLGINRLYRKVKSMYTWPNMKKCIVEFVNACTLCKHNKHFPNVKTKQIVTTTPMKPFDVVSIDTVEPFTMTENGNRYAITMQCDFTKYVIIAPIPDKSANTVARTVINNCILQFGPMKSIKTDQGTEYKGVFDEICDLLKIDHTCSTAYHPQTIGALERNHRCLNEYLRIFSNEARNDWDTWMPYYAFSYNTTPNVDHDYTPFELVFGRKCNTLQSTDTKIQPLYNFDSYEKELKYRMQVAHTRVLEEIQKTKSNRTKFLNENLHTTPLQVNDTVYLKLENRQKLDSLNAGPFKILDLTESNAVIKIGNKISTVHRSRLIKR